MKDFRPQVFLFRLLAGIFLWEGILLAWSFQLCARPQYDAGKSVLLTERCPRIGQRAENMFEIAIATTLSLLAGGTQINLKKPSSDKPDASAPPTPAAAPPKPPANMPNRTK